MARTRQQRQEQNEEVQQPPTAGLRLTRTYGGFFSVDARGRPEFYSFQNMLVDLAAKRFNNFIVYGDLDKYAYVEYLAEKNPYVEERKKGIKMLGPKIHFSVKPEHLPMVWSPLIVTFGRFGIDFFKGVRPDKLQNEPHIYCGKQITIYCEANRDRKTGQYNVNWSEFFIAVEKVFIEYNCEPGIIPPANKMILGSRFISHRNDLKPGVAREYISDQDAVKYAEAHPEVEAHNPSGQPDPLAGICVLPKQYTYQGSRK